MCVCVQASDVLASLLKPGSKSGSVLRAALGDDPLPTLADLFHVGQYVRCQVSLPVSHTHTHTHTHTRTHTSQCSRRGFGDAGQVPVTSTHT